MKTTKTKEVTKFLTAQGWSVIRSQGPHDVWAPPDGSKVFALPRHKETSPGIIRQLSKIFPQIPRSWK
ncbi:MULTISPECIES: type II toxin-antitoxin system HicA family toxin [Glutamicibacter]|uniref:type II toxin-antitoxin system HicA family toxin n=1 Tax=Glutamicibacter TaxID=1742989 RepID=UPI000BB6888B|nr:type II toxin-antitoxin system HicA family toxin [Glutamicibacter sp. BW80]PCC27497.1 hypothetical protein CIK76_16615 [Glutamicibacter sp. BW80]